MLQPEILRRIQAPTVMYVCFCVVGRYSELHGHHWHAVHINSLKTSYHEMRKRNYHVMCIGRGLGDIVVQLTLGKPLLHGLQEAFFCEIVVSYLVDTNFMRRVSEKKNGNVCICVRADGLCQSMDVIYLLFEICILRAEFML